MTRVLSGSRSSKTAADGRRIRRIEDAQVQVALGRPERPAEHVRREAAAAHAGDDRGREARLDHPVAEALERRDPIRELHGRIQPAEAVGDGLADLRIGRPERHVTIEQAGRPFLGPCLLDGRGVGVGRVAEGEVRGTDRSRRGIGHRGLRAKLGKLGSSMVRRARVSSSPGSINVPCRPRCSSVSPRRPRSRGPCRAGAGGAARR